MTPAVALAAGLLAVAASADPATADPLLEPLGHYSGRTVVSGTGEPNRSTGTASCLVDVLVKVSGDPSIATDPRLEIVARDAGSAAVDLRYRDRLEGRPVHDDQGTYDRPHILTVTFDPEAIRRDLAVLGREPWLPPRPLVVAWVDVAGRNGSFRLARDDDVAGSTEMREALSAAAETLGLTVTLPRRSESAPQPEADRVVLAGELRWSDDAMGWVARWQLTGIQAQASWSVRGVNFDEAFRVGIRGSAQVLSGHGQPH